MIVLTVHDLLPHDTAQIYKKVFQDLYRRTDAIICHSDHIKARLVSDFGISPGNIYVIPHGPFFFDLPERSPEQTLRKMQIGDGDLLVLWQGIIFPYKGLDLLLTAWQRVEREVPHAVLVVVGTGAPELLHQISEQVQRLGLQRVRLHLRFTSTEELVDFYRAAGIVVYPYRAITTSGALATGVALGKTIVASDLPVFRELLTHGEEALLVPVADTGALAGSLCRLLQDRELRERLARAVRAKDFGHQSWMSIAAKTAHVYDAVLDTSDAAKTQRRERLARDAVRP